MRLLSSISLHLSPSRKPIALTISRSLCCSRSLIGRRYVGIFVGVAPLCLLSHWSSSSLGVTRLSRVPSCCGVDASILVCKNADSLTGCDPRSMLTSGQYPPLAFVRSSLRKGDIWLWLSVRSLEVYSHPRKMGMGEWLMVIGVRH